MDTTGTFDLPCQLIGAAPKKGEGVLDGGQTWKQDRVELHVLTPLDESKGAKGLCSQIMRLEGCDQNWPNVEPLVGRNVVLKIALVNNGRGKTDTVCKAVFALK